MSSRSGSCAGRSSGRRPGWWASGPTTARWSRRPTGASRTRLSRCGPRTRGATRGCATGPQMPGFFLSLRQPRREMLRDELTAPRLERAIGVIYRPETELQSHYFRASLPRQFDEWILVRPDDGPAAAGRVARSSRACPRRTLSGSERLSSRRRRRSGQMGTEVSYGYTRDSSGRAVRRGGEPGHRGPEGRRASGCSPASTSKETLKQKLGVDFQRYVILRRVQPAARAPGAHARAQAWGCSCRATSSSSKGRRARWSRW